MTQRFDFPSAISCAGTNVRVDKIKKAQGRASSLHISSIRTVPGRGALNSKISGSSSQRIVFSMGLVFVPIAEIIPQICTQSRPRDISVTSPGTLKLTRHQSWEESVRVSRNVVLAIDIKHYIYKFAVKMEMFL